jgi:hypothetical protein
MIQDTLESGNEGRVWFWQQPQHLSRSRGLKHSLNRAKQVFQNVYFWGGHFTISKGSSRAAIAFVLGYVRVYLELV